MNFLGIFRNIFRGVCGPCHLLGLHSESALFFLFTVVWPKRCASALQCSAWARGTARRAGGCVDEVACVIRTTASAVSIDCDDMVTVVTIRWRRIVVVVVVAVTAFAAGASPDVILCG